MAIDAVDPLLVRNNYVPVALEQASAQLKTQEEVGKNEAEHAAAQKAADKKAAKKNAENKSIQATQYEAHDHQVQQRLAQVLGGAAGPDAAHALHDWQQNNQLQANLTKFQVAEFQKAFAQQTPKATEAAQVLNRLSTQPGFGQAINNSKLGGTLHHGVLQNPRGAEKPAVEVVRSPFMQSPHSNLDAKNSFLRAALAPNSNLTPHALRQAGDILGALSGQKLSGAAQQAAVNAFTKAGNTTPLATIDTLVSNPAIRALPQTAKSHAVEFAAKAGGKPEVAETFVRLASHPDFQKQSVANRGQFFATVGSGKASEYRGITDKLLASLSSPQFPGRVGKRNDGKVARFLGNVSRHVASEGLANLDTEALLKAAKKAPTPKSPSFLSTAGLTDEEAAKARAHNRAQILSYFNAMEKLYGHCEKGLKSAVCREDVNALQGLREPARVDTSALSAEEKELFAQCQSKAKSRRNELLTLQRSRARELKHMPPHKRRQASLDRKNRLSQPRYFRPGSGRVAALAQAAQSAPLGAISALPKTPAAARMQGGLDQSVSDQVARAVAQAGQVSLSQNQIAQMAKAIAAQVTEQVVAQLSGRLGNVAGATDPSEEITAVSAAPAPKIQTGKVDAFGIPRTFDRDLGGFRKNAVSSNEDTAVDAGPVRSIVRDPSTVRSIDELMTCRWKSLSPGESACLRNLGWDQKTWDGKDDAGAVWPIAMGTEYGRLSRAQQTVVDLVLKQAPTERADVKAKRWDSRILALKQGKTA